MSINGFGLYLERLRRAERGEATQEEIRELIREAYGGRAETSAIRWLFVIAAVFALIGALAR